jgi:sulfur carrier protein
VRYHFGVQNVSEMTIRLNGGPESVPAGTTLAGLLERLGLKGPGLAVAVNEAVVRAAEFETTPINPGDRIEIIRAVGGG